MPDWTPDEEDIQFGQQLIRTTKQGATWAAPQGVCVYEIDHENKTLIERIPSPFAEFREKTKILFQTLGWTVQDSDLKPVAFPSELVTALKTDEGTPEWN
jgi:hypothetical protein